MRSSIRAMATACCVFALSAGARGQIAFNVTFDDPADVLSSERDAIRENLIAAGALWSDHLEGQASIEVVVRPSDSLATLTARSLTAVYVDRVGGLDVYEQGAASEIRTGVDPNGDAPDVEITIGVSYLESRMWFDPDPSSRSTEVPADRVDAVSSFLHELAHALFMNGWRDGRTGRCFDRMASTWDAHVVVDMHGHQWFVGPAATAAYGSPVPVTLGDCHHVGNVGEDGDVVAGADLCDDVLTGVRFRAGHRYRLSPVDVAMARDVVRPVVAGVPVASAAALPELAAQPGADR